MVKHGHRKGYTGRIRNVGSTTIDVELDALITGSDAPFPTYQWRDLMDL
jgi:hypothetical protein